MHPNEPRWLSFPHVKEQLSSGYDHLRRQPDLLFHDFIMNSNQMHRPLLTLLLALFILPLWSQEPTWSWARAAGGPEGDHARARVSPNGEVYLLGTYADTIDANGTTVMSDGLTDLFVQQLDPTDGSVQWTAEAHNPSQMEVMDLAFRSTGELVVCGFVYHDGNDATFGPYTIPGQDFGYQAFIAGLSPAGAWTWLSVVPNPTQQSSKGWLVKVDGNDDILLHCGIQHVWVHKFTGNGVPVWNTSASSDQGSLDGYAMDVTADNGLVITGRFYDTATFGNIQLVDATVYYDIFIAKLDDQGAWQWAVQAGGSHWDKGFGVCGATNGDVYVTGTYRNVATFGPFTCTGTGSNDLWTARLTNNGQWLWVNPAGTTTGMMEIYDLDLSPDGDRLVCGGSYAMNATVLDGHALPAPPNNFNQAYVAEMDTLGNFISARGFGGLAGDQVEAVAYLPDGGIIAAGNFGGDMILDNITLTNTQNGDIWVGRLDPSLPTQIASPTQDGSHPRLVWTALGPMVLNPSGTAGLLTFVDAIGRELGAVRISGASEQAVTLPDHPGLLVWKISTWSGTRLAYGTIPSTGLR